ncbi:GTP-binding protein HflX [Desulforhopalus singaporensis]|uniref:GTPase HflX n=1 Tax=Desulforhopalus singaporensis TaxID=91360 RepID=A0A1H0NY26_9BACT|nr:GTP-binding protein HflX [Desulforhopalus singaporensis]
MLCQLSSELNRQIGLLIHRSGKVEQVIVGSYGQIVIPQLGQIRSTGGRLRGLRLVHTHLANEDISDEDLMDLLFLRLDLLSALKVDKNGLPHVMQTAHLLPESREGKSWVFLEPVHPANQVDSAEELIVALEREFAQKSKSSVVDSGQDRAILVSVSTEPRLQAEESLAELVELAASDDVAVLDTILQRRQKIDPRFILGKGKLADIMIRALQHDANLLIFNQELNPSQIRSITDFTDLRVIDRTQLILDIFAHRAMSREGKLQVEMAQLKYMLPRLSSRDDALSRLTGGIGARGPGETKLEIDRRRINDRLARLGRELAQVSRERYRRRAKRRKKDLPVLSLVGYTNAGKSTLLNTLTNSDIVAEDKLFATLDPTSRRLRFPTEMEVIITDTVGFIRHLPAELVQAFMATLEELGEADLLIHVVDVSNPAFRQQMKVVDTILRELDLGDIPVMKLFNKVDLVENRGEVEQLIGDEGLLISALQPETLKGFLEQAGSLIEKSMQ